MGFKYNPKTGKDEWDPDSPENDDTGPFSTSEEGWGGSAYNWAKDAFDTSVHSDTGGWKPGIDPYSASKIQHDREAQGQSRDQQGYAADFFKQGMLGQGPSVAEKQLQEGVERAGREARSTAASARGTSVASAGRAAAQGAASAAMGEGQKAAALRAQEQQAFGQQYAGVSQQMRQQDLMEQGYSLEEATAILTAETAKMNALSSEAETSATNKKDSVLGFFGSDARAKEGVRSFPSDERTKEGKRSLSDRLRDASTRLTSSLAKLKPEGRRRLEKAYGGEELPKYRDEADARMAEAAEMRRNREEAEKDESGYVRRALKDEADRVFAERKAAHAGEAVDQEQAKRRDFEKRRSALPDYYSDARAKEEVSPFGSDVDFKQEEYDLAKYVPEGTARFPDVPADEARDREEEYGLALYEPDSPGTIRREDPYSSTASFPTAADYGVDAEHPYGKDGRALGELVAANPTQQISTEPVLSGEAPRRGRTRAAAPKVGDDLLKYYRDREATRQRERKEDMEREDSASGSRNTAETLGNVGGFLFKLAMLSDRRAKQDVAPFGSGYEFKSGFRDLEEDDAESFEDMPGSDAAEGVEEGTKRKGSGGGGGGGGSNLLGAAMGLLSDRRAKEDAKTAGQLEGLYASAASDVRRPPGEMVRPDVRQPGATARFEDVPGGSTVVRGRRPDGEPEYDGNRAISSALAGVADINRKLKELEGEKDAEYEGIRRGRRGRPEEDDEDAELYDALAGIDEGKRREFSRTGVDYGRGR